MTLFTNFSNGFVGNTMAFMTRNVMRCVSSPTGWLALALSILAGQSLTAALTEQPRRGVDGLLIAPRISASPEGQPATRRSTLELAGPDAELRIAVYTTRQGQVVGWAENATLEVSDPRIAALDKSHVLRPRAEGQTVLRATWGELSTSVDVAVRNFASPTQWSFRNHVLPVLAKAGCNSGACHGALAGKGGFKLSLRGYDPSSDYLAITKQARGRRVELSHPGQSLLLTKPLGIVPHKGGVRMEPESRAFQIVSAWIAQGASPPLSNDPQLEQLQVFPELSVLGVGDPLPLSVVAHYSDGSVEEVTPWVKFTSTNEAVCRVTEAGRLEVVGPGEGAVTAWFSQQIAVARVSAPFANQIEPSSYDASPKRNLIDELVLKQLRRLNLEPSERCTDDQFVRRVYLDTIGTLPNEQEWAAYFAEPEASRRDWVIEQLLASEEFVDYWTYKWSDLFLINGTRLRPPAVKAYYQWLRGHVQRNTPWDQLAREVVTAKGDSLEQGATNFYALHQDPESMTENVSQAFLGLSIGCAKCHNHPLEKWTNDQYYAMANLFARVRAKGWGGDGRNGNGMRTLYVANSGELIQPLTGKPQPPTPLDGEPIPWEASEDRRIHLAQWLTAPENPYFARAIANRVWANYFGVGLVEPVDDLRLSNPASNEELLDAAAEFLVESNFDLKALMRLILQSETYQRSSQPMPSNSADKRFYSRYYPRRLMAEVLLDAISQVTGVPSRFQEIEFVGADKQKTDFYPEGTRALELYDSAVSSYFLKTFGRNQRRITCECERSEEPSMVQVLHLSNGVTINEKLKTSGNWVDALLAEKLEPRELVQRVYRRCLSRQPTDAEVKQLTRLLAEAEAADGMRVALEDLLWGVMSSREFLFNH